MADKLRFDSSDVYYVLIGMDFNECIQFAQEYLDYKKNYKEISCYPKMNELYEKSVKAYYNSIKEENIFYERECFRNPTEKDLESLKYHVIEQGYFWCKTGLKDFIRNVYMSDVELFMDSRRY